VEQHDTDRGAFGWRPPRSQFLWRIGVYLREVSSGFGAFARGVPPYDSQGGVYIFEEPLGGWQNAKGDIVLTASDVHISAGLGSSVSISGKVVVGGSAGLVYVFGLP
jgi:hypothetical protein